MSAFGIALGCLASVAIAYAGGKVPAPRDLQRAVVVDVTSLTLNPASVIGGAMVTATVTVSAAAGPAGVTVNIASSAPAIAAVPVSVVVQPGATSATFIIQTAPVTVNPNVVADAPSSEISVQTRPPAKTAKLTVRPPILSGFTINPTSVPGGAQATGEVTISGPAPSGGVAIALDAKAPGASDDTRPQRPGAGALRTGGGVVSVPGHVTVQAGKTSATFTITTKAVAAATPYQLDARQGVFVTKSATLTLQPPVLSGVTFDPQYPIGGTATTAAASLTAPAPAEGLTYTVSTSSEFFCGTMPTVPPSIQIAGGATSGSIPITTAPGFGTVRIRVSGYGQEKGAELTVREAIIDASSLQFPTSIKGGTTVQAKLHLNGAALPLNCVNGYKLESSNTQLASVPDRVVVTPGQTDAPFSITTAAVPSSQTVAITVFGNVGYGYASVQKTLTLTP